MLLRILKSKFHHLNPVILEKSVLKLHNQLIIYFSVVFFVFDKKKHFMVSDLKKNLNKVFYKKKNPVFCLIHNSYQIKKYYSKFAPRVTFCNTTEQADTQFYTQKEMKEKNKMI